MARLSIERIGKANRPWFLSSRCKAGATSARHDSTFGRHNIWYHERMNSEHQAETAASNCGPTIWIDGDAAPREVKELVYRASKRLELRVLVVANQSISVPLVGQRIQAIVVSEGANMADKYILENAELNDLALLPISRWRLLWSIKVSL